MCYAAGSIDAVNPCPMCKVFPHARCPHIRETCRNRALHPRMDVLYIKNAEVERFNGCGYCKWARTSPPPPPETLRYSNPGWPGCCRAPSDSEKDSIPAADWRAVSIVHNVPIPPEIKAMLDVFQARGPPMPPFAPPTRTSTRPANDRKNSGGSPSTKPSSLSKTVGSPTSVKPRSGSSPQAPSATLSRTPSGTAISSPVQPTPASDLLGERRQRVEGVHSSHPSPNRKNIDLGNTSTPPSRRSSVRRPTVTPATTSVSVSKVVANSPPIPSAAHNQVSARRRSSVSKPERYEPLQPPTSNAHNSTPSSRPTPQRPNSLVIPTTVPRSEEDNLSSASSSSGSSDGIGSLSDSTITSDGGFTDYLSDESEAELQRQAEAKAALLAINMAEELEFKAARLQLAHVDLRPPKSWNPTTRFPARDMVGPPMGTGSISSIGQARS